MSYENPETIREFYDRLQAGIFSPKIPELPSQWLHFRREAEARHAAGESTFGSAYLTRDNKPEGQEEGADGANYAAYDHFQWVAEHGVDDDIGLVLEIGEAAYNLHKKFSELAARRRGSP